MKGGQPPPATTGSIKRPAEPTVPDYTTVNRLVDCRLKRLREIDRLVERRKYAWGLHSRCKADFKAPTGSKQTADEACVPLLAQFRVLAQQVSDREAKDECAPPATK